MNSKQGSRYKKTRMDNELKNKILVYSVIVAEEIEKKKPSIQVCSRCESVNVLENSYSSRCGYPLKPKAFEEIKFSENNKFEILEEKYDNVSNTLQNTVMLIAFMSFANHF
jgi:hypothetical protein